jgi:NAD(P)H-dependent flavin oxidoreductase YrpB (nitropropane dioxygenase family)
MKTALTDMLGCQFPLIQTAMGWVADANLVAATASAGGFGFLAGAVMSPAEIDASILEIKAKTDKPFGVNFHMYVKDAEEIVDLCCKHKVAAVSYSRSPNAVFVERLKASGIKCIPTVGAAKHAVKAVAMGADAVVVQGGEGGGHTGSVASTILLPEVVDSVNVPVVAAGGFKDGRGLVAALALGASGIAMGTRFLLTQESPVPAVTKNQYIAARPEAINISKRLDGLPQRMISNPCLTELEKSSALGMWALAIKNGLAFAHLTNTSLFDMLKSAWKMSRTGDISVAQTMMAANAPMMIQEAMVKGHPDEGILPSGQVAGIIDDIPTVEELIQRIMRESEQALTTIKSYS